MLTEAVCCCELQECMINPQTYIVHLDDRVSQLGPPFQRTHLTGVQKGLLGLKGVDCLESYITLVLKGDEREHAQSIPGDLHNIFQRFATIRKSARAADKQVALRQIYFSRVL
jgi:hypothetical protein